MLGTIRYLIAMLTGILIVEAVGSDFIYYNNLEINGS